MKLQILGDGNLVKEFDGYEEMFKSLVDYFSFKYKVEKPTNEASLKEFMKGKFIDTKDEYDPYLFKFILNDLLIEKEELEDYMRALTNYNQFALCTEICEAFEELLESDYDFICILEENANELSKYVG